MHQTTITLTVLSEEPIPDDAEISDIVHEAMVGDYSMDSEISSRQISPVQMAEIALAQGTDPEFFGLDAEGNRVEN